MKTLTNPEIHLNNNDYNFLPIVIVTLLYNLPNEDLMPTSWI